MTVSNLNQGVSSYFAMPTQATITAGASWYGSCVLSNLVYQYAPTMITNAVISASQRQFGTFLGTIVGNATAPAIVAHTMPRLILGAQVAGAFMAAAAVSYAFQQVQKASSDRAYQQDCTNIAADCDLNGRVSESDIEDENDLVSIDLRLTGNGDDFEVGVLDELA